jgi:hypothetical protein
MSFCEECCNKPCHCYVTPEYLELRAERDRYKVCMEGLLELTVLMTDAIRLQSEGKAIPIDWTKARIEEVVSKAKAALESGGTKS